MMDEDESYLPRSTIESDHFESEDTQEQELDQAPNRSPVVGSGLDDSDGGLRDGQDQLGSEDFETEERSISGLQEVDNHLATSAADGVETEPGLFANAPTSPVSDSGVVAEGVDDQPGHDNIDLSPLNVVNGDGSMQQEFMTNSRECRTKDDRKALERQLDLPPFEGDSLSIHDRDPNYATQRPDTLGAINLVPPNAAASAASAKVFQNANSKTRTRFHGRRQGDAPEDMIFDMVQLGRRTRGAGMDQLELNQHHLIVGSDDGSDSSDAAEPESNQCESTEADQYKMNPEADQSESLRPDFMHEPVGADCRATRSGIAGNGGSLRNARDVEQAEERYLIEDDDQDEDQFLGTSEIIEDDQDWERLNDQDLADRTEDDRQYNIGDRNVSLAAVSLKASQPGGLPAGSDLSMVAAGTSLNPLHFRLHPNSAFSQLRPNNGGGSAEGCQTAIGVAGLPDIDKRPVQQTGAEKKLSVLISAQEPQTSKRGAVFKPILHENKPNSLSSNQRKGNFARQQSDSNVSDGSCLQRFGAISKHGKTLSDNGIRSRRDSDAVIESPRLLASNPSFEAGSSESLHSCLPSRSDHLIGEPNQAFPSGAAVGGSYQPLLPSATMFHSLPLSCDYEPQTTPQKQPRSSYHMMEDSLELSPIRPPSSQASHQKQMLGMIQSPGLTSVDDLFRATAAVVDQKPRAHCYNYKMSSETGSEINDIQEVRGHLHGLLMLSDRTIPDKAHYDQTNEVDELLTGHSRALVQDQPSSWSLSGLHEALPLSSKYLLSGPSQAKLDVAGLAAENRALRDAVEQQRFKRKHCEKQIQQLQNKVLELQQNLAVAVSIDRKKDLTIEQLDKTLVKVAEDWRQKESERHETIVFLQQDNAALKQTLDSQQQLMSRLELQLNHTMQQLQLEQQRTTQLCLNKDQHISELTSQYQRIQLVLDEERQQWQQRLTAEQKEAAKLKEKMQHEREEAQLSHEEEVNSWREKERENLLKIEQIKEAHSKIMDLEKAKLQSQEQAYHELEMVLRETQAAMEQLQIESETIMREKESLKVEMGLMEARHLSSLHQLEAELQSSAEKKLVAKLDELNRRHLDGERSLHENHHRQLQELGQQHLEELEQLKYEHQTAVSELEESVQQHQQVTESRVKELEKQVRKLEKEKQKIEIHKIELANQLQSMMQSHCEEALRLLRFTQPSSNLMATDDLVSGNVRNMNAALSDALPNNNVSPDWCPLDDNRLFKETGQQLNERLFNDRGLISSVTEAIKGAEQRGSSTGESASPQSLLSGSDSGGCSNATVMHPDSTAQYAQFLAGVRNYQPLLADLNASLVSVANSVSTLGQAVHGPTMLSDAASAFKEPEPSRVASHRVGFHSSPIYSPVQLQQVPQQHYFNTGSRFSTAVESSSDSSLMNPHFLMHIEGKPATQGQRQRVDFEQHQAVSDQLRSSKLSTRTTIVPSLQMNNVAERNVNPSGGQQASLLKEILQHDLSNLSEESIPEHHQEAEEHLNQDSPNHMESDKLRQQEYRQQQLHHYIRMLLQKPHLPAEDDPPARNVLGQQDNIPVNKHATYKVKPDSRPRQGDNEEQRPETRLSSPEQDLQLNTVYRNNDQHGLHVAMHQGTRNPVAVQPNYSNLAGEAGVSLAAQAGNAVFRPSLVELYQSLEQHIMRAANSGIPVVPSSSPSPLPPLSDLLKFVHEQNSQMKASELAFGIPAGAKESQTETVAKDGILPRNHPNHLVNKDNAAAGIGPEMQNIKPDPSKQGKLGKSESTTKPKNVPPVAKPSEKKEKPAGPRNSNKHAAWK